MDDVNQLVEYLVNGAARVASTDTGLPMETFQALARHVLGNLAGYRHRGVLLAFGASGITQQDENYLARMFQSVYANLQDYEGDIR